jgi:hypothetical protein
LCGQPTGKTSAFVTGGHYVFAGNRTDCGIDCGGEAHGAANRPFSRRFMLKIRLSPWRCRSAVVLAWYLEAGRTIWPPDDRLMTA